MLPIPEKCLACPMMQQGLEHLETQAAMEGDMIHRLVSDEVDTRAQELTEIVQDTSLAEEWGSIDPEDVAQKARSMGSSLIDLIKNHNKHIEQGLAIMALGCAGPLRLEARRNAIDYAVTICASPFHIADDDTNGPERAIVERRETF